MLARRPIPPPSMPQFLISAPGNRRVRRRHWADAPHAHHRPGQRRQGGRRARAAPRRAAARAGARRADAGRRRALRARAAGAGIVFGAEVTTFPRLMRELAAAAGVRGAPLGPLARERLVRAAVGRRPTCTRWRRSAAAPGLPARRATCSPSSALARRPGALHARGARLGGRRRRRRTRASSPRSTRPTTAGWRRSARSTPTASPARRSTRCASGPPPGTAGRCSSTASTT